MTNVNNGHIAQHPPVIPALPTVGIAVDLTSIAAPAANTLPQVSIQDLNNAITAADTAYVSSRTNAATAAATVFYVWTHTCSELALQQNKGWYDAELARIKADIEAHNKKLDAQKKDEEKQYKAAVKKYKDDNPSPNSKEAKEKYNADLEDLKKTYEVSKKVLTDQRMVKVEARADAAPFTEITKFVLKLHGPTQASQVNRFATVVQWLSKHVLPENILSITAMANHILANEGFDAVYEAQRAEDAKLTKGSITATNNSTVTEPANAGPSEAVLMHFRKMVEDAEGVNVPELDETLADDGLITLIARKNGDGLAIISKLAIPTEEVLRLCVDYKDNKLLPGDARAEFVATALAVGELVEEGTRPAKDGDTVKIQRICSMVVEDAETTLVVSALGTDLSIVVHAKPNDTLMDLFPQHGYWTLDPATAGKPLQARLANAAERKMVALHADTAQREVGENCLLSNLAWISTDGPMQTKGDTNAVQVHSWLPMSPFAETPVDVDAFSSSGTLTVTQGELDKLIKGHIGKWASVKADSKTANKAANKATVKFSKSKITVTTNGGNDVALCSGSMKTTTILHFRPRTLSKVIKKLAALNVRDVTFAPDERGALQVTFEDDYGSYAIYVPSCKEDGTALTARFAKIRVPQEDEA